MGWVNPWARRSSDRPLLVRRRNSFHGRTQAEYELISPAARKPILGNTRRDAADPPITNTGPACSCSLLIRMMPAPGTDGSAAQSMTVALGIDSPLGSLNTAGITPP